MLRFPKHGYSATELLLALGLVGVLAAVAFPSFAAYSTPFRVQAAGREVYSALVDIRQQSITLGKRTRFQISDDGSYALLREDGPTWHVIRGPLQLDKNVRLLSSGGNLTFQPRGTVAPMSTLTISDVANPEHRLVISVPITGLIRIRPSSG